MTQFFETTQAIMAMGAVFGCGSFAAGALTLAAMQRLKGAGSRGSRAGARSLAMLTVLALDDFVGASYAAVHDSPEFDPMDEGEFAFHAPEPVFVLPKDADWAVFGEELSDEIMWLSNRASNLSYALDSLDLASADYDRFFERRQQGYVDLARRALDLIDRLLGEFDLHLPAKPDYYHQREGFAAILKTSGTSNPHMKKVALMSNGSNITQLFPKTGEEPE